MAECATAVVTLLEGYGLEAVCLPPGTPIPGSYWGESEAGLIRDRLYFRADTPVHSALHEACHYICMDGERRANLDTDAGGEYAEEDAVCYLQILLAQELADVGASRMCEDMDGWGYTFRLGSAGAWFEGDAEDARDWLVSYGLVDEAGRVTGRRRE